MYYSCIACITIDSVININKKKSSPSLFRRVKIQNKEKKMPRFINAKLKLDSNSDLDLDLDSEDESKPDAKLMAKLEKFDSDSDSDSEQN